MMFRGAAIEVRYSRNLRDTAGNEAHAATFLRSRLIVLDHDLLSDPAEHRRILLHELFHFAWLRLGNPARRKWEELLAVEWRARVRGEAGWSAEWRKQLLSPRDLRSRSRRWRDYCCESFCDTGAVFVGGGNAEATLGAARLQSRLVWFREQLPESLLL